jgi:hypothetical protein
MRGIRSPRHPVKKARPAIAASYMSGYHNRNGIFTQVYVHY